LKAGKQINMASDQDKFLEATVQAVHQWQAASVEMAWVVVGGLLIAGVLSGACLAVWIFRGGLSRSTLRN
jgi:hypothetical protein